MRNTFAALVVTAAVLMAGMAQADTNTVPVTNNMGESVRIFWTAAGCAGVVEGRTFVCDSKVINPGQSDSYTFRRGTTIQKVSAAGPSSCYGKEAVKVGSAVAVTDNCTLQVADAPAEPECDHIALSGPERALPGTQVNFKISYPVAKCARIPLFEYTAVGPNGVRKIFMLSALPTAPWTTPLEQGEYRIVVRNPSQNNDNAVGQAAFYVTSSPCLDFVLEAVDTRGNVLPPGKGVGAGENLTLRARSARCDRPLLGYQFGVWKPDGKYQGLTPMDNTKNTVQWQAPNMTGNFRFVVQARSDKLTQAEYSTTVGVTGSVCSNVSLTRSADGKTLKASAAGCRPGHYVFTANGNRYSRKVCEGRSDSCIDTGTGGTYYRVQFFDAPGLPPIGEAQLH